MRSRDQAELELEACSPETTDSDTLHLVLAHDQNYKSGTKIGPDQKVTRDIEVIFEPTEPLCQTTVARRPSSS